MSASEAMALSSAAKATEKRIDQKEETSAAADRRVFLVPTHAVGLAYERRRSPRAIQAGAAIDLEVALVDRPLGQGCVQMRTAAHVVRVDETETPGWSGYAASFDDISFERDDVLPTRTVTQ